MNEKELALNLIAIAAGMLTNAPVAKATVKVEEVKPCMATRCASRPTPQRDFTREPDGVQINVDRPRRENYRTQHAFAKDMANYRMLIDQAKKCEWPSRIPSNIPAEVHANRRDWYEDNEPVHPSRMFPMDAWENCGCGWGW